VAVSVPALIPHAPARAGLFFGLQPMTADERWLLELLAGSANGVARRCW
jgi:hypothetical protein